MDGMQNLILAGDIGGTKTYLGLFGVKGGRIKPIRVERFVNARFPGLEELLALFLSAGDAKRIKAAAFGLACPVENKRCTLTNMPWTIDGGRIEKRFRIKRVELINDLVATGTGIGLLSKDDLFILQKGKRAAGNAALIAAGTGLGEAMLFWDGGRFIPVASEGGHADYAARTPIEIELLKYLTGKYGHVSYERVLSGRGIEDLYDFLKARSGRIEPVRLKKKIDEKEDAADVITGEALSRGDRICRAALKLFISVYGAEAGNLALKSMAVGGLYIGGGIAPKILKAMKEGAFIDSFVNKGRFSGFLRRVPVYVILNDMTALHGAAQFASAL